MTMNLKNMKTEDMIMVGTAAMAVGVAAAVTAGVINSRTPMKKMKKIAKKTAKGMENIADIMFK